MYFLFEANLQKLDTAVYFCILHTGNPYDMSSEFAFAEFSSNK